MEVQPVTPVLQPFAESFICPNCSYLDAGKFCSECSESLLTDDNQISITLVNRLLSLGYKHFSSFVAEEAEGVRNYDFSDFNIEGIGLVYFLAQGVQGLRIELILIGNDSVMSPQFLKNLSESFTRKIDILNDYNTSLKKEERPKEYTEYIERIELKYIVITDNSSTYNAKEFNLKNCTVAVKTGLGFWKGSSSYDGLSRRTQFSLAITFEVITLDVKLRLASTNKSKLFNVILYNASVALYQTHTSFNDKKTERKRPFALIFFFFIFESFIDYFRTFIQFLKSPYFFAELIINKKCIPLTKIVNYYLVGLVCSVTIPILLSGGYITSDNLTLFSNLPPFIGDMAELGAEVLILYVQVLLMHFVFKLFKHRGNLQYFFMGMLFIKAFFQMIDRPYDYFVGVPLSSFMFDIDAAQQYARVVGYLGNFYMIFYFIVYYPVVRTAYKVTPRLAITAFSVPAILFLIMQSLITQEIPFTKLAIAKSTFHDIMDDETKINEKFNSKLLPALKTGDKTGDYKEALASLPEIQKDMQVLTTNCDEYNTKHKTPFTTIVGDYYTVKYTYFMALEQALQGNISSDSLDAISDKVAKYREKIKTVSEEY